MNSTAIDIQAAEPAEWPTLISIEHPDLPRIKPGCLPGWAGEYALAVSEATETPLELATGMLLATVATATARRLRVEVKPGYEEPCNLWMAVALPPGNRKSAVQGSAAAPLQNWERESAAAMAPEKTRIASERMVLEMRAKDLRTKASKCEDREELVSLAHEAGQIEAELPDVPSDPQLWTSDSTPERLGNLLAAQGERIAWLSSEGGVFDLLAGRYSGGIPNLDLTLKAWSGDAERVDRNGRPPVHLQQPLLSIGLSPQPDVLRGLASKPGFRGRGLLGRFLYLLPPSPLGYRVLETKSVPDAVEQAYTDGLHAMLGWPSAFDADGSPVLHTLRLSSQASSDWLDFSRHIETTMRPGGKFEYASDWAGKCPGQAIRLAGILHGIRHTHGQPWRHEISADTMNAALELMAVIAQHSLAAMDLMGADDGLASARLIWEWAKNKRARSFTVRDAHLGLQSHFSRAKDVRRAIDLLEERGYVRVLELPSNGGRPPSPQVQLRPELAEGWS